MNPSDLIIPLLLAGAAACGTGRRVNVYAALTRGAEDGLTVLLHVIPALVGLLTAVSMFRASGAMDALARLCAPVLNLLGIPAETVPLMLVRPVSGSGALAVASGRHRRQLFLHLSLLGLQPDHHRLPPVLPDLSQRFCHHLRSDH